MARTADHSRGSGASHNPQVFSESSDFALVQAHRRGNQAALDALMARYHQFVRLKASSYFLAGGDAEDLIQEGMLGLYKAVRDYRDDRLASFRSFAELCITRQIITAIKTATRQKHVPLNGYLSFSQSPGDASWNTSTYTGWDWLVWMPALLKVSVAARSHSALVSAVWMDITTAFFGILLCSVSVDVAQLYTTRETTIPIPIRNGYQLGP
jgi:DNA-directed RNA polymerase specialized sigma24 family protein